MSFPLINPAIQFLDSSGAPLANGTIEFRNPADDTYIDTFPTADDADAQTNANANPLTLNSRGEAASGIYLEDGVKYKITLRQEWPDPDTPGAIIWTQDDVLCPTRWSFNDIRNHGAVGDGTTNDRAAFVAADALNEEIVVAGGNDYVVASDLTITNPVRIEAGSTIKPSSGVTVTFSAPVIIDHWETAFTGDGTVAFTEPQIVRPDWWDRTDNECVQKAWDYSAQGSRIEIRGKYTITRLDITSDEANQTGDIGKSMVGIAGPGTRIRDKTSGDWGAELYLADAQDTDVILMTGTDQGSGTSSRFSVYFDNFKINGNKTNQSAPVSGSGLKITYVKDLWIGRLLIEDCWNHGFTDNNACNQIHWDYLEVQNCGDKTGTNGSTGGDGVNLGATADSAFHTLKTATNADNGFIHQTGQLTGSFIHSYLNGTYGVRLQSRDVVSIDHIRVNNNDEDGVHFNDSAVTSTNVGMHVGLVEAIDNGQDTGVGVSLRSGLKFNGTCANCVVDHLIAEDTQGTTTQQYHIRVDSTGSGNYVGQITQAGDAGTQDILVVAGAREAISFGGFGRRTISTATGDVELSPELGDLVMDTTLSGAIDFDYTTATVVPNGHKQKILILDGGGQNITAGTNVTAQLTLPTPATNAKKVWLEVEYYGGVAYITQSVQEP